MAARAIPEMEAFSVSFRNAPPTPMIKMTDDMTKFLLTDKSILLSINILSPLDAIIPNSKMDTPPITAEGMEWISAEILPMKPKAMANTAAPPMT